MRRAVAFVLLLISLVFPMTAHDRAAAEPDVTVVLHFKGSWTAAAVDEMRKESDRILQSTGLRIGWMMSEEAAGRSFSEVVVLTFNGACMFQPEPPPFDALGPFASTSIVDGMVQPFAEVNCDHVAGSVKNAMAGGDAGHGDLLVGRALGRVIAHELVHMLTHSEQHGEEGVQTASLTGKQLIAARLPLGAGDADRVRLGIEAR